MTANVKIINASRKIAAVKVPAPEQPQQVTQDVPGEATAPLKPPTVAIPDIRGDAGFIQDNRSFEERVASLTRTAEDQERLSNQRANGRPPGIAERLRPPLTTTNTPATPPKLNALNAKDFIEKEFPSAQWRVDDLVPGIGTVLLYGAYKTGKSLFGLQLSLAVAAGQPFLGREVDQCPVLFIEEEGDPNALQDRIMRQATSMGLLNALVTGELPLTIMHRERVRLDDPAFVAEIRRVALDVGAKLIIVGPLSKVAAINDENSAPETNAVTTALNDLASDIEGCVALVHHRRKDGQNGAPKGVEAFAASVRGSTALVAGVDAAIGIGRDPEEDEGWLYVLLRDGEARREHFTFDRKSLCIYPSAVPDQRKASKEQVVTVLTDHPWSTITALQSRLDISRNTVIARMAEFVQDGIIVVHTAHQAGHYAVAGTAWTDEDDTCANKRG